MDEGRAGRTISLRVCFKMCRDALAARIRIAQDGRDERLSFELATEGVAAIGLLSERGVIVDNDWQAVRDHLLNAAAVLIPSAASEKAVIAQNILARITPELSTVNIIDRSIIVRYVDDAALLVYEFGVWAWVRKIEVDATAALIQAGRKPGKSIAIEPDPYNLRVSFKNKAPQDVVDEAEVVIAEHKRRVKWAKQKLRVAAKQEISVSDQADGRDRIVVPILSGAGKRLK